MTCSWGFTPLTAVAALSLFEDDATSLARISLSSLSHLSLQNLSASVRVGEEHQCTVIVRSLRDVQVWALDINRDMPFLSPARPCHTILHIYYIHVIVLLFYVHNFVTSWSILSQWSVVYRRLFVWLQEVNIAAVVHGRNLLCSGPTQLT